MPGRIPVVFSATWHRLEVGWDVAVRAFARAMHKNGIDVRLYPIVVSRVPEVDAEVGHLSVPLKRWEVFVQSSSFARAEMLRGIIWNLARQPGRRVLYTMFERQSFDPAIAPLLRPLDAVWVPCSANRDALHAAGIENAVAFPVPYFDDDPLLALPRPTQARIFYWMGNWSPRKAPENLVRAFLRAFSPADAELRLKTGPWRFHRGFPEPEQVIASEFLLPEVRARGWTEKNWHDSIRIDRRSLTRAEVVSTVHAHGDVYVSASRGEGYDLPAYEAKLAGRRVITTDSGGPRDFLGDNDILIPATGQVPVHRDYVRLFGWETHATYADYPLDALVAAFVRARSEPVRGDDWPREKFTALAVGDAIRVWLAS